MRCRHRGQPSYLPIYDARKPTRTPQRPACGTRAPALGSARLIGAHPLPESHESQDSPPVLLEVERFEQVHAREGRVILRVDGRYGDRPGRRVLDAKLYIDDGLAIHRHAPLRESDPGLIDDGWLWRASYEVPASYLTDARTRFALESQPGHLLDLPRLGPVVIPSSAVPVTSRTAHIARRYAAAIAILLAAAVAPGGLPAQAGEAILHPKKG